MHFARIRRIIVLKYNSKTNSAVLRFLQNYKLIILLFALNTVLRSTVGISDGGPPLTCGSLRVPENIELTCQNGDGLLPAAAASTIQRFPISTVCKYKCKPYYVPYENTLTNRRIPELVCLPNGQWRGVKKYESFSCREDCGKRVTNAKPLIVNGVATNASSWPWHAVLFRKHRKDGHWTYICGGSLVRNGVVMSAAHCVSDAVGSVQSPAIFRVVLGARSSDFGENINNAQIFEVRRVYISQSYDPQKGHQADIALLHLVGTVHFSDFVLPVCLPNDFVLDQFALKPGNSGDVVGFGADEVSKLNVSKILKHASLKVSSHSECFSSLHRTLTESQFCAGNHIHETWQTVCNGDSGGGLVFPSQVLERYYIHGIVSTGDSGKTKEVCQNYAVFTRVFQFIFWVRDILERISGDVVRELAANVKLPYIQRGSEISYTQFVPFPRAWDNKVTSVELLYADIDVQLFAQSMQQARGLEFLNMSHVSLAGHFAQRVVLPHLHSVAMDIPDYHGCRNRRSVCSIKITDYTEDELKALLFFDKEYGQDWHFENITHLKVNINLIVHTFKLLQINHEEGRLSIQLPHLSKKIVQNLDPRFQLRYLALGEDEDLDGTILALLDHTERRKEMIKLKSLVIQDKSDKRGATKLSRLLRETVAIEQFGIVHYGNITIFLERLPKSVTTFGVEGSPIKLTEHPTHYYSKIFFPGFENISREFIFPEVEFFGCYLCKMEPKIIENIHNIFPNVKRMVLCQVGHPINVTLLVERLPNLEWILFGRYNNDNVTYDKVPDFIGLGEFTTPEKYSYFENNEFFIQKNRRGKWNLVDFGQAVESLKETQLFEAWGAFNFWASGRDEWEDFRLTEYEKIALQTGHYKFDGGSGGSNLGKPRFRRLPPDSKDRLSFSTEAGLIKTVQILNADVLPLDVTDTIELTPVLESLVMENVDLFGSFFQHKEVPRLTTFKLNTVGPRGLRLSHFVQQKHFFRLFVPFIEFVKSASTDGIYNEPILDYAKNFSATSLRHIEMSDAGCMVFLVDFSAGKFVSRLDITPDVLKTLVGSGLTNVSIKMEQRKKLKNDINALPPLHFQIPFSVRDLNLHLFAEEPSHDLSAILSPLVFLKSLRLIMSTPEIDEEEDYSETEPDVEPNVSTLPAKQIISLSDLKAVAHRLEFLAISNANLTFSPGIKFPNLKTILFKDCVFDESLLLQFFDIFQPERLGLMNADDSQSRQILVQALKNERLGWILYSAGGVDKAADFSTQIMDVLGNQILMPSSDTSESRFIIERPNRIWKSVVDDSGGSEKGKDAKNVFDLKVHELLGLDYYGSLESDC